MMQKTIFLLFTAILFLNASCNKDDECLNCTVPLPNTFSCYMNETLWEAEYPFNFLSTDGGKNIGIGYKKSTGYFHLNASKRTSDDAFYEELSLRAWEQEDGSFLFDRQFTQYRNYRDSTCFDYYLDTLQNISLNLTEIDTLTSRMKGNFELTYIETECLDTIRITNVLFDSYFTGD